jgi:hypothetical protein
MFCKILLAANVAISCVAISYGQTTVPGAESAALGGISVVLENPWSAAGNPAGLAGFEHLTVNTSLEQRYLMKELGNYAFGISLPAWKGTVGICAAYQGYQAFSNATIIMAYGMRFGDVLSAGAGLCYIRSKAGNENPALHQVSYSLGTAVILSEKIKVAFSAFNPFNLYYKSSSYATLPAVFRIGMAYKPSQTLAILAEMEKTLDYPVIFRIGCQYNVQEKFYINGGLRMFPASFTLGAGFRLERLLIELASAYHQYLGFTPGTSIQYLLK